MDRDDLRLLETAKHIQGAVKSLGLAGPAVAPAPKITADLVSQYFLRVTDTDLRRATERLFADGHYARSVEEAFKCLNNYVKERSGRAADGAALMRTAFSPNAPLLKLNKLKSQSHKDEQTGYMDVYAGCMTGIRNPRAHEHRLTDTAENALELLAWANHLIKKARAAVRTRRTK